VPYCAKYPKRAWLPEQGLSTVEARHGHVVLTLQVNHPTSPCPT